MDNLMDNFNNEQKQIIKHINERLDHETWTELEIRDGRLIYLRDDWTDLIKDVIIEYKRAGWIIKRHVELSSVTPGYPTNYLRFHHPLHSNLVD